MSHIDALAEFDNLSEALDVTFSRALNLAKPKELTPLISGAERLQEELRWQSIFIEAEIFSIDQQLQQPRPPAEQGHRGAACTPIWPTARKRARQH